MKSMVLGSAACLLSSVCALAADMGVPISVPPAPPPFTWTGCYAGAQAAGGWGQKNLSDTNGILAPIPPATEVDLSISGWTVGGQIGCDYQFAPSWVVGIEGAVSGGNIGGNTTVALPAVPGDTVNFNERTDFLASITGRVGYAWDRWLLYAKGGAAWAGDNYGASDLFATYAFQGAETRIGWTAGAGVEWALWENWSVELEYDYYGFGTRTVTFVDSTISGITAGVDIKQNIQVVRLGVNFHVFANGAPVRW
jgi:outer membrane immunogenic protein